MRKKLVEKVLSLSLAAVLALSMAACSGKEDSKDNLSQAVDINAEVDTSVYMDASKATEERIEALIKQMTTEEKVGQLIQAEQGYITTEEVTEYYIGSVLSGGGSAPSTGNSAENWNARLSELKEAALATRLSIPLLYGVDAVHGNNNISGATLFPHNIGLGAANDPELMKKIGQITANEVSAIAANWDFSPCVGNPQNVTWGRTYEGYSENVDDISPLAVAYIEGLQEGNIIACAKHFIGEGYTENGTNQGDVKMTPAEFDELLKSGVIDPYKNAVDAGVYTVMASYNSVDGVKCHENYHLLTEVLKGELGFTGLVVGDYNAVAQVSGGSHAEQVANCVNAGVDLLMEPDGWKAAYEELLDQVNKGNISKERLDDAVTRNLRVKFEAGLFDGGISSDAEKEALAAFGSQEHREVAREAVRKSLVLLKNEQIGEETAMEAIAKTSSLSVIGQKAYDIGSQCGGWSISWQGQKGNKMFPGATPIIQGFAEALKGQAKVSHSADGSIAEGADGIVVVVGEGPYAETDGDVNGQIPVLPSDDKAMLESFRESLGQVDENIPVVAVVVAGRPVDLTPYEDMFDAIVMAWLPGTEGEGIADVMFGQYDFTGTTKYTWPNQYEYGLGLDKKGQKITQ